MVTPNHPCTSCTCAPAPATACTWILRVPSDLHLSPERPCQPSPGDPALGSHPLWSSFTQSFLVSIPFDSDSLDDLPPLIFWKMIFLKILQCDLPLSLYKPFSRLWKIPHTVMLWTIPPMNDGFETRTCSPDFSSRPPPVQIIHTVCPRRTSIKLRFVMCPVMTFTGLPFLCCWKNRQSLTCAKNLTASLIVSPFILTDPFSAVQFYLLNTSSVGPSFSLLFTFLSFKKLLPFLWPSQLQPPKWSLSSRLPNLSLIGLTSFQDVVHIECPTALLLIHKTAEPPLLCTSHIALYLPIYLTPTPRG